MVSFGRTVTYGYPHAVVFMAKTLYLFAVRSKIGVIQGQVISTMREACRQSFLDWSPRLYLAMYSCDIQASGKYRKSIGCIQYRSH